MSQERLGRYRILERIAAGNQGSVFRAFDPDAGRLVALKVLHPTLTGDKSYLERFHREASLASSIDHPNVARIYDVGEADGQHYIALEYLPENLARLIQSGDLPVERAAKLAAGIADGLAEIHALGIVHRDLKPQNVLITPEGVPKVTDFGIARSESASSMTATGAVMGTPYYMSPEQARGDMADARSDVYALGCVIYELLTGEVPFEAPTPLAVIRQHIEQEPRPVRRLRADVPRPVADVVEKAMRKDPEQRYANGAELAIALRQAVPGLRGEPGATNRGTSRSGMGSLAAEPSATASFDSGNPGRFRRLATRSAFVLAGLVAVVAVAFIASALFQNGSGDRSDPSSGSPLADSPAGTGDGAPETAFLPVVPVQSASSPGDPPPAAGEGSDGSISPISPISRISAGATAVASAGASGGGDIPGLSAVTPTHAPSQVSASTPSPEPATPEPTPQDAASGSPVPVVIPTPQIAPSPSPAPAAPPRWTVRDPFTFDALTTVSVGPDGSIHAGGDQGVVYNSSDGGATWDSGRTATGCTLRQLDFVSGTQAVALDDCGDGLNFTGDGGRTWERYGIQPAGLQDATSIHFLDSKKGWITGSTGFLATTNNGGATWERVDVPTRSYLKAVYFADKNLGWVGGLNGGLLMTRNGGLTWHRVSTPNECPITQLAVRMPLIWAAGDCGQVIFSPDGGDSWADRSLQDGSIDIRGIDFLDGSTAWITGMVYDPERPVLVETRDGGRTWQSITDIADRGGYIGDIAVRVTSAGPVGWAVGSGGLLLKLTDESEIAPARPVRTPLPVSIPVFTSPPRGALPESLSWSRLPEFTFDTLYAVAPVGGAHVQVAGEAGAIYRSADGGATFDLAASPSDCSVTGLQFVSADVGLAADSCGGNLIRTADGGAHWERLPSPPLPDGGAAALYFLDSHLGWVTGWNGGMARTRDGGETWVQIDVPTSSGLDSVYFADESNGWVAGPQGVILRTRNGGAKWERADTPLIGCRVVDIDAHLPSIWAVDECGGVYFSTDGGKEWAARSIQSGDRLRSVAVWDDQTAWVAGAASQGDWPVILETRDGGLNWRQVFRAEDARGSINDLAVLDTADGAVGWAVGEGGVVARLALPDS